VFGLPRSHGSGVWTVLEPNHTVFPVQTRTAGGLPGPVATTSCHVFHFDLLKLTIYSSRRPTCFHYYLPHHFHNSNLYQEGSGVGDYEDYKVITENRTKILEVSFMDAEYDISGTYFNVITCFAIQ